MPIAPESPSVPYWPISAELSGLDLDDHEDYVSFD